MIRRIFLVVMMFICLGTVYISCDVISPEPGIEQIKSDLIGETLTQADLTWHFHALSEFIKVTIEDKIREADTIEYDVSLQLQDVFTGKRFTAEILMIYQRVGTHWDLFSILTMSLKFFNLNNNEPREVMLQKSDNLIFNKK